MVAKENNSDKEKDLKQDEEQPELTGDESSVEAEEADYKANKVDEDSSEIKSPLKGKKAED